MKHDHEFEVPEEPIKHEHEVEVNIPEVSRIRKHWQENKKAYLVGGGCLVAGLILRRPPVSVTNTAKNIALLQWQPKATNIAVTQLVRRGHPGYMIKCIDTGETFASINRAAEAMGVNRADLYRHLRGDLAKAGGHIFENLGEMK